ncbi:MAG: ABC transporter permease [Oscillospiraceae bacterium]|nr:ABC transporter permease [Oscillospiraceae bacterium]
MAKDPTKKRRKKVSRFAMTWHQLKKNKLAMVCLAVLICIILVAVFAKYIAPYSYEVADKSRALEGPSKDHLLGTDRMGRDLLSRLIYGTQQSLSMGIFAIVISAVVGILLGSIAGYFGGWVDNLIMRLLDIYQSIPMMLLCITFAAVLGPSLRNAIIAIGISMVPGYARMMRASILTVRDNEYIDAAKMCNCTNRQIILSHIIPNAISPLIVTITMSIGGAVLSGAGLSFIGLGVQSPVAEWGAMISDGRNFMRTNPTLALYPGLCIMITVLAFNLLGDGLRDALDPRLKN